MMLPRFSPFSPRGRRTRDEGQQSAILSLREVGRSGRQSLQLADQPDGLLAVSAAHIRHGAKAAAHRRAFGLAEDLAAELGIELDAGDAGRFALGHAGNGAADAGGDATGTAALTTFHVILPQ